MADTTVKFGIAQVNCPTPTAAKTTYRILFGVAAIWAIIAPSFPEIPEHLRDIINRIILVSLPVFYAVCQMFGWDIQKPKDTPNGQG